MNRTTQTQRNEGKDVEGGLHALHAGFRRQAREASFEIALNQGEAPRRVHITPMGEELSRFPTPLPDFSGRREESRWVLTIWDEEARQSMLDTFEPNILIDYEHSDQSLDPASSTAAAGWGARLAKVADGLEAEIDWTPSGEAKIKGREYRYISPVCTGIWENLEGGESRENPIIFRPRRLDEAGLTNRPALKGWLRAITKKDSGGPNGGGHEPKNTMNKNIQALLCSMMALDAAATEATIESKLGEFVGGELATIRNRAKEADDLKTRIQELETERLEADLKAYEDVIEDVESAKVLFRDNRGAAIKTFEGIRKKKAPVGDPPHVPLAKRTMKAPTPERDSAEKEQRIASRAMKIHQETGCGLSEANRRARAEER